MNRPRTYPAGVPCWVDTAQPDPEAACRFYRELFGWTFEDAVPAAAPVCTDPAGAAFRLWQPRNRPGAQAVNVAGAWNFSHLQTNRPDQARAFYGDVFGWESMDAGGGAEMWRQPGYGDHLEATVDPDIRARQAHAPEGFEDAVAGLVSTTDGAPPHWSVVFTVADRDDVVAVAQRLGADVLSTEETMWTREAVIRDPQGAELTLSQFVPPDNWG
jgi:uncharacterized protein